MLLTGFSSRWARAALIFGGLALSGSIGNTQSAPAPAPPAAVAEPAPDDMPSSADVGSVSSVDLAARPALILDGSSDWDNGLTTIMAAVDKLNSERDKAGLQSGGRPIAVFTDTDDQGFKFTAMAPLVATPAPAPAFGQDVKLGETPAGKTMKFEHRGSYDDIDTSYEAITAYLDEKGLEAQNLFIEEYLTTPKDIDDPDLEVDIYVFLK